MRTRDSGYIARACGAPQCLTSRVSDAITASLSSLGPFVVVERQRLAQLSAEHKLVTSGIVDGTTAGQIGKVLGVDDLLMGSIDNVEFSGIPNYSNQET